MKVVRSPLRRALGVAIATRMLLTLGCASGEPAGAGSEMHPATHDDSADQGEAESEGEGSANIGEGSATIDGSGEPGAGTAGSPELAGSAGVGAEMHPTMDEETPGQGAGGAGGADGGGTDDEDEDEPDAGMAGNGESDAGMAGDPEPLEPPSFGEVYDILVAGCGGGRSGCHITGMSAGLALPDVQLAYEHLVNVDSLRCPGELLVVPGDADASVLVTALEGTADCVQPWS
jgi:hypothetical protein